MCNPMALAIASFAMQAGSTWVQYQSDKASANYQTQLYEANRQQSIIDMQHQLADANTRQLQEQQAAAQSIDERRRKALMEASTAKAAAADRGVSGFTVGALLAQVMGDAGRDVTTIETNRDWNVGQIEREKAGIRSNAISRIHSVAPGIKPSGLAAALKIGGAAMSSYGSYQTGGFGKS